MMPFTPLNDDFERVVESETKGEPEEPTPGLSGGEGAVPKPTETEEALKQEGALDETEAELTDKR